MHYLPDVAIFAVVLLVLFVLSASSVPLDFPESKNRVSPEDLLLGVAALLGVWSLAIWFMGWTTGLVSAGIRLGFAGYTGVVLGRLLRQKDRQRIIVHYKALIRFFRNLRGLELVLTIYLLAVFALTFVLTLAPPNGADYDSLMYHLAAPAQYLRGGRIRELPYDHHSYFPFTMEMLYLLGLELRGPVLAKLFHWLMLVISCGALVCIGRRHLTLRAGLFAAALFASLPMAQTEASTAYADLGLTAFVLLAFLCFFNWMQSRDTGEADNRWLVWSGVFCGFCLGVKYLGALTFGWLLLWAIGLMMRRKRIEMKPLLMFCVWALVLGGGWYARNWMQTGNPVFPFAYGIFGGRGWTSEMATAYSADQAKFGFGRGALDWILLPWRMAMTPLNLGVLPPQQIVALPFWPVSSDVVLQNGGKFEVDGMLFSSILGPALLALGAPLLFIKSKPRVVGFALWSFGFFFVFWGVTGQYLRYLMPAFALLCVACGWGAEKYLGRSALLKWTCGVFLTLWLAVTPMFTLWQARGTLPVIAGIVSPHEYLTRTFSGYAAMRRASIETPPDARFAVYGEPRCFYLERDYFWADDQHNNLIDYSRIKTGADFIRALKAQGATHILQNAGVGGPPPQMDEAVAGGQLKLLFEERGYRVYQIEGGSAAR